MRAIVGILCTLLMLSMLVRADDLNALDVANDTNLTKLIDDKNPNMTAVGFIDSNNSTNLIDIVSEIDTINHQLSIIQKQNVDKNISSSAETKSMIAQKQVLLNKLPTAITQNRVKLADIQKFINDKELLINKVKRASKDKTSKIYIESRLELQYLKTSESFYKILLNLESLYMEGASKTMIENLLQNGIIELQTADYEEIKNLKQGVMAEGRNEFDMMFANLEIHKASFDEILNFLLKNSGLLESNIVFTSLNLKSVIDIINLKVPFQTSINWGKIILIILIMMFSLSLTRIVSHLIYLIFAKLFANSKEQGEVIKTQVVDIIKRPIRALLIAYAAEICASIFYYPAPISLSFSNSFSIIYTVFWAWLILGLLDGYGMILLSRIAQKSSRKEVINLVIKIMYIIVVIISLLIILKFVGFDVSTLVASLGIGGLAVALATKDIIANFFASILLLVDNSFSQGDWVVVDGVEGTVVETGLRKTAIRTFDNALVFVQNSSIMSKNIKNWSRRKVGRKIHMTIGVDYSSTKDQIVACIEEIKYMLTHHEGIAKPVDSAINSKDLRMRYRQNMVSVDDLAGYKNTLFVTLDDFGESSINIMIYCFTKTVVWGEFLLVKQDIMLKIMEILNKNSVSFAFPSQSVYIEKMPKFSDNISIKQE